LSDRRRRPENQRGNDACDPMRHLDTSLEDSA